MDIKIVTLKDLIEERPDLVEAILAGGHEGSVSTSVEKDKTGKITKWTEERRDLDGVLISKRFDDYIYKETGEIDTITMRKYDGKNNLVDEKIVEHLNTKDGTVT